MHSICVDYATFQDMLRVSMQCARKAGKTLKCLLYNACQNVSKCS